MGIKKMEQSLVCNQCGQEAVTRCSFCSGIPLCGECFIAHNVIVHKNHNVGIVVSITNGIPIIPKLTSKVRRNRKLEQDYIRKVFTK
jgi:hypothetical protein